MQNIRQTIKNYISDGVQINNLIAKLI